MSSIVSIARGYSICWFGWGCGPCGAWKSGLTQGPRGGGPGPFHFTTRASRHSRESTGSTRFYSFPLDGTDSHALCSLGIPTIWQMGIS